MREAEIAVVQHYAIEVWMHVDPPADSELPGGRVSE